jgi:acetyltransferase
MVGALLNPKNVVILGATDKPGNWAERANRNLARYGFTGAVYPMNPSRDEIWGTRCYRSFADLPEKPDHIVVIIPARMVPDALRDAARAGARSATVFSSGFGESGDDTGRNLAARLEAVIEETGLAVSGPNCLGNIHVPTRLMTMTDDRPHRFREGPVAIFGQSGGIAMSIKRTLEERAVDAGSLITAGNEAGLKSADYINFFAHEDATRVLVCYLESVRGDPAAFFEACRAARARGKTVVFLKLGESEAGRAAALAHTGALAGSMEAFDAAAGEAGAVRCRNTDDVVEAVEYLVRAPLPKTGRAAGITLSGGMRGLLIDAAAAHQGLVFEHLSPATHAEIAKIMGVGSIVGNPLDGGFAVLVNPNALFQSFQTFVADPAIDIILIQEELTRGPGSERKEENMRRINELAATAGKPVVFLSMISHSNNDYSRAFRETVPNLVFMQECDKSVRVLASIASLSLKNQAPPPAKRSAPTAAQKKALEALKGWKGGPTLDEVTSKAILAAYGVPVPKETLARTRDEAVAAAKKIGFPVVAKIVSAALPHKSDVGGVKVGLADAEAVAAAFDAIMQSAVRHTDKGNIDGILIAEMVKGGLELVLGVNSDPEVGPVILVGSGGVDLELVRDVALAVPPLDKARAQALLSRTRASQIMAGYRGRPRLDADAVTTALVGLSNLVLDAGGMVQSIDVNPFLAQEKGGVALDGLIVVKR